MKSIKENENQSLLLLLLLLSSVSVPWLSSLL